MALKTDFKDAVWVGNRRIRETANGDGTNSYTDETDYSQVGDFYGAALINSQNTMINALSSAAQITIALTDWSASTTTVSGKEYYTAVKSVTAVHVQSPDVFIGAAGVIPTEAEQSAYNALSYVVADDTANTLTFYAEALPEAAVVVQVRGVTA